MVKPLKYMYQCNQCKLVFTMKNKIKDPLKICCMSCGTPKPHYLGMIL